MRLIVFFIFFLLALSVSAQIRNKQTSLYHLDNREWATPGVNKKFSRVTKTVAVPVVLFSAGVFAMSENDLLSRYEFKEERDEYFPKFRRHVDDYLQYAPIVTVYGLNALGVKGKHDFRNRTALLVKSEMIMAALTFSLKKITAVPRPDTGQPTSFPSGHTAQAFAAATFMVKEYGDQNVLYAVGAYSVASGIGILRVMNNRHWVSDVLAGAGVGILSTNLAYLTHQYKWSGRKNKRNASTMVLPAYDGKTASINLLTTL